MSEHPEFDILGSLSLVVKEENGEQRRYFKTIASSTVEDSHGDEFTERAIQKMADTANAAPMTIFLNHEYRVPEDVFGTAMSAKVASRNDNGLLVKDLDIDGIVNEANPRAKQTADLIANGARLGVSIGARVKEYRPRDPKDPMGGWIIDDVELKEASIVGLPANPRTWVQYATKAIRRFERERVKEAADMSKSVTIMADEDITDGTGDDTIELIVSASVDRAELEKVFTTDNIFGEADPEPEPDPDAPSDDQAEAEADAEEPTPDEESPEQVTASETPAEALSLAIETSAETLSLSALRAGIQTAREEIEKRDRSIEQLTKERDAALETLATATAIVNKIAVLPLGRKAVFKGAVDDFHTRIGTYYEPEVMMLLKGPEPK